MSLQRALAELFKVIRDEANSNAEFALKLEEALATYRPSKRAKQRAKDRVRPSPARPAPAAPTRELPPEPAPAPAPFAHGLNPVSVLSHDGEDALRAELDRAEYSAEALAALAAEHNLDPAGAAAGHTDKGAWVEQIVAQAKKRVERDSKLFDY